MRNLCLKFDLNKVSFKIVQQVARVEPLKLASTTKISDFKIQLVDFCLIVVPGTRKFKWEPITHLFCDNFVIYIFPLWM